MSHASAQLSHDHNTDDRRTLREWADITGKKEKNMMRTIRRHFPGEYTVHSLMSADQFYSIFSKKPAAAAAPRKTEKTARPEPQSQPAPKPKPSLAPPFSAYRRPILYALMLMPAAASVQNMYSVTADIATHEFTALLLTGLFSAAPFLFVMAGMSNPWTKALAVSLIAYECFSNVTRIYGGLTGFGRGDFPTRFLGLVCDFFNSGTYLTAKTLAALMASMAAAVFYAAFHELNKTSRT